MVRRSASDSTEQIGSIESAGRTLSPERTDDGSASMDAQLAESLSRESVPQAPKERSHLEYRRFELDQRSLITGIAGLAAIALLLAIALPIAVGLLNEIGIGNPTYIWMQILLQSLLLPPMVAFSFTAVTPMFWYGSIILRFAIATLAILPACIGFVFAVSKVENGVPDGFIHSFSFVMFTSLMAIATVALTVQLWSRWTLSHARSDLDSLPPTGIGSLIELTVVAAVGCAVFMSNEFFDYLQGMFLLGGIGFMAAIAIIITQISFLRDGPHKYSSMIAGFVFAFAAAMVMNGFFGVVEYGWDVLSSELFLICAASLYGAVLIYGLMWVCLSWLRYCGWQCVDRSFRL